MVLFISQECGVHYPFNRCEGSLPQITPIPIPHPLGGQGGWVGTHPSGGGRGEVGGVLLPLRELTNSFWENWASYGNVTKFKFCSIQIKMFRIYLQLNDHFSKLKVVLVMLF